MVWALSAFNDNNKYQKKSIFRFLHENSEKDYNRIKLNVDYVVNYIKH